MSTQQDFINKVRLGAIEGQKRYGVYASVTIAQAIYESGWGTNLSSKLDNNLFGIKFYGNHDPNLHITKGSISTSSDSDGGTAYAKYKSWGDSIIDHGYFLAHNSRYKNALKKGVTANEQIKLIMEDGYADTGYSDDAISIMKSYNLYQYDTGDRGTGGTNTELEKNSKIIESAISWAINIANDNSHGYDQNSRWGPDYDCSSFVISAFEQSGLKLKENGASFTGDMEESFKKCGFSSFKFTDEKSLKRGDVLLNTVHHTAIYLGNGKLVQASSNEYGGATGGKTGDQTGKEIWIRDFYDYPWDIVLRLESSLGQGSLGQSSSGESSSEPSEEVYKKLKTTSYNLNSLNDDELNTIKSLSFNDKVKIKQTFYRSKKILGYNNFKQRLTFINYTFILKDVNKNGFFILTVYNTHGHNYFYINPKFIKKGD